MAIKNGDQVFWNEDGVVCSGTVEASGDACCLVKVFDLFTRLKLTDELHLNKEDVK